MDWVLDMSDTHSCVFCDETFDEKEAMFAHEAEEHPSGPVKKLQNLLDTFEEGADRVSDLKRERDQLKDKVSQLQKERIQLKEAVNGLRDAKERLRQQSHERENTLNHLRTRLQAADITGSLPEEDRNTDSTGGTTRVTRRDKRVSRPERTDTASSATEESTETMDRDTDDAEVELVDDSVTMTTAEPATIEPAPDQDDSSDVAEWHGYDPDREEPYGDATDIRARVAALEHENKLVKSSLKETEELFDQLRHHAEELAEDGE